MKRFLSFDPDQPLLLPPDLREALPEGHPALLVDELVGQLDLSEIYEELQDGVWGGKPGFHPRLMVGIWVYAYLLGMRSSRQVAKACVENVAFRVVARNQTPGHWALNRFRTRHRAALGNLFTQTVQVAASLGLVSLANVAIDGTKIRANASKHKAMSYGRMDAADARLRNEIEGFLDACDEQDEEDEITYGPDDDGMSLPEGLRDTQARRNKIAQAKRELEERAKDQKKREQEKRRDAAEREGRSYTPRTNADDATPKDSDQINFTDPESRIMTSDGAFVQAYNAQTAVDTSSHVVVAAGVGNAAPDAEYLPGLMNETLATTGRTPTIVSADAGYFSRANLEHVECLGAEPLIPPNKIRHHEWHDQEAPTGPIPKDLDRADRMRRRLATKEGKRLYVQRQGSVEPVFGTTKTTRNLQQFPHRGLEKNHHLFRFDMAVHNILKIIRHAQHALKDLPALAPRPRKATSTTPAGIPSPA